MKKNEDHLEKIDSALNDSVKNQKAQEKADEKCIKQAIDLVWKFFGFVFFLGMLLLPFGPWLYDLLPSQVLIKESIAYYDSLRVAKVDSTVDHKEDSIFTLYNPKDTLIFWGEIDENELIQQLTTLTFRDTIYLQLGRSPVVYGQGDYIMFNPIKDEMFRIIIKTDKYRLNSSFARF